MALVKTTTLAGRAKNRKGVAEAPAMTQPKRIAARRATSRRENAAERSGAATLELSSGGTEAAGAVEELRRALGQIFSGAEEAADAAHESLAAMTTMTASFGVARERAA